MISALDFCTNYPSFWRVHTPHMERFTRHVNLGLTERLAPNLDGDSPPDQRGLINEIANRCFNKWFDGTRDFYNRIKPDDYSDVIAECHDYVSKLSGGSSIKKAVSANEHKEIKRLCARLATYVQVVEDGTPFISSPTFPGYGMLDACSADGICGNTLIEIKSGDRAFRSTDFRQALTYFALNTCHKAHPLSNICLLNPRTGLYFKADVDEIAISISGCSKEELIYQITFFWSSGGVSK